jgi:membrane dipeptidase
MLIFDAHLDLAMNALEWNRDLTRPVAEIRDREKGQTDKSDRGRGTVSLPEMRRGGVGICVATTIARYVKPGNPLTGWHSPEQAWAQTQGQLAWYRAMEQSGQMVQITDTASLSRQAALWSDTPPDNAPIGYILSLEGADSIITPAISSVSMPKWCERSAPPITAQASMLRAPTRPAASALAGVSCLPRCNDWA